MAKFIFNRIHLDSSEKIENKVQFLMDGLISKSATSHNKHAYKLIDVELKNNYISGYLIKYDPYSEDEVFDEESETLSTDGILNKVVAKSFFIIDHKESLLIYEIVPNQITKPTFTNRFRELFIDNHKEKRTAFFDISEIVEQYTFLEKVKSLKEIDRISLILVPSNPRFADRWKDVDERLRENNIGRYQEVQQTKNRGGIIVDEETEDKILMSEDGYGTATVKGIDQNGVPTILTTKNKERVVTADVPRNIVDQGIVSVVNYLSKIIQKIKDRTSNE